MTARHLLIQGVGHTPQHREEPGARGETLFVLRNPWGRVGLAQPGAPLRDPATDGRFSLTATEIRALFDTVWAVDVS